MGWCDRTWGIKDQETFVDEKSYSMPVVNGRSKRERTEDAGRNKFLKKARRDGMQAPGVSLGLGRRDHP